MTFFESPHLGQNGRTWKPGPKGVCKCWLWVMGVWRPAAKSQRISRGFIGNLAMGHGGRYYVNGVGDHRSG
jgi:hypothetical protein